MTPLYREIQPRDVPALFDVRTATAENRLSHEELRAAGITEPSVISMLEANHCGWLCKIDGQVVGFSMVDRSSGELWVIAVLPDFEGQGIGSELLRRAEECLWAAGFQKLWLWTTTDAASRAPSFYRKNGWQDAGEEDQELRMEKRLP